MAKLPGATVGASINLPVEDNAKPDTATDRDGQEMPQANPGTKPFLCHRQGVDVVVHPYRDSESSTQRFR